MKPNYSSWDSNTFNYMETFSLDFVLPLIQRGNDLYGWMAKDFREGDMFTIEYMFCDEYLVWC